MVGSDQAVRKRSRTQVSEVIGNPHIGSWQTQKAFGFYFPQNGDLGKISELIFRIWLRIRIKGMRAVEGH